MLPIAVQAALEGDGALLARLIRESSALDELGSPRDFSTARYATICETTPLPWDPGTPIDQRPAVIAAADRGAAARTRSRRLTRRSSSRTRSTSACAGRTCRARASTAAPLPYPTVPTLILQGGEDLRTPPEWSARVAARIPGAQRFVDPRRRPLDGQRPARLRRRRDRCASSAAAKLADPLQADPDRRPRRARARRRRSTRCASPAVCRARSGARCSALAATSTTCGSSSPRPLWRPPAAVCAAARGRSGGNRLVLRGYQAVTGVTVTGSGNARLTLRVSRHEGGARNGHAARPAGG